MRFFFKSRKFKAILSITVVLCILLVSSLIFPEFRAWQSDAAAAVITPIQKFCSNISRGISDFFDNMQENEKLKKEIEALEAELAEKDYQLIEYESVLRQNEFYKDFLEIKENNPSFEFTAAMLIARDTSDPFYTFTIDKGTLDGVSVYDPVITAEGLVGYISDAYSTQSVVMTILNPSINVSVIDNRTRDSGNICGMMTDAQDGNTRMIYIAKSNTMAAGDSIITSGAGGVFPAGQNVGTVKSIKSSSTDISCYAVIEPAVDFDHLSDVMVITDFEGKK